MRNIVGDNMKVETLLCIGVDGKNDKFTCVEKEVTDKDGKKKKKFVTQPEHHLTFTQESGDAKGDYLTHKIIPQNSDANDLSKATAEVIKEYKSKDSVRAILLDNTSVNTGCNAGLVVLLEG